MIKFLSKNELDVNATFSATSASTSIFSYLYDNTLSPLVSSSGSDDVTDEVYTFAMGSVISIDSIFIGNHNIKKGEIEYSTNSGVSYNSFSPAASWNANTNAHSFFQFTGVGSITHIRMTMETTIDANDEKSIGEVRLFTELGEVEENPIEFEHTYIEAAARNETANGGIKKTRFGERFKARLLFQGANATDMSLFRTLKDRTLPFYVYPSGGATTWDQEGFRIQDLYEVVWAGDYTPSLRDNFSILGIGTDIEMLLEET